MLRLLTRITAGDEQKVSMSGTRRDFGWHDDSDYLSSSPVSPSSAVDAIKDVQDATYVTDTMESYRCDDKQRMQIERAVEYFARTYPNFEKHFVRNKQPRISFLEQRWEYFSLTSRCTDLQAKIEKVQTLIGANASALSSLSAPRMRTEEENCQDVRDESNRYFWILVELTLLYDDNYAVFFSLHFDDANSEFREQDERTMVEFLRTVKLWTLPSKLVKHAGIIHHNQRICEILETMFLRLPCQLLTDALGNYLPWSFLIDRADNSVSSVDSDGDSGVASCRDRWRSHAQKCFMPRLKELTNLITPINSSILEYLWNVDEAKIWTNEFIRRPSSEDAGLKLLIKYHTLRSYLTRKTSRAMQTIELPQIQQMRYGRMMGDTEWTLINPSQIQAPTYVQLMGETEWTMISPNSHHFSAYRDWQANDDLNDTNAKWQTMMSMTREQLAELQQQSNLDKKNRNQDKRNHHHRANKFTTDRWQKSKQNSKLNSKSYAASSHKHDRNRGHGSRGR